MRLPGLLSDAGEELADLAAGLRRIEPHLVALARLRPELAGDLQAFDQSLQRIDALSALMRIASQETPEVTMPACTGWLGRLRLAVFARRFGIGDAVAPGGVDLF